MASDSPSAHRAAVPGRRLPAQYRPADAEARPPTEEGQRPAEIRNPNVQDPKVQNKTKRHPGI